jgi:cell division septal protein FtsQ
MSKKEEKKKGTKKGGLRIVIWRIISGFIILVGYIIGCAFPPTYFLPISEVPVTGVDAVLK